MMGKASRALASVSKRVKAVPQNRSAGPFVITIYQLAEMLRRFGLGGLLFKPQTRPKYPQIQHWIAGSWSLFLVVFAPVTHLMKAPHMIAFHHFTVVFSLSSS